MFDKIERALDHQDLCAMDVKRRIRARYRANVQRALQVMVDHGTCVVVATIPRPGRSANVYGLARNHRQVEDRLQGLLQKPWGRITGREDPHATV